MLWDLVGAVHLLNHVRIDHAPHHFLHQGKRGVGRRDYSVSSGALTFWVIVTLYPSDQGPSGRWQLHFFFALGVYAVSGARRRLTRGGGFDHEVGGRTVEQALALEKVMAKGEAIHGRLVLLASPIERGGGGSPCSRVSGVHDRPQTHHRRVQQLCMVKSGALTVFEVVLH